MITLLKQIYQGFIQAWKTEPEELETISPLKVVPLIRNKAYHSYFLMELKRQVITRDIVYETAPIAVLNKKFNLMDLSRPYTPPAFRMWSTFEVFSINAKLSNVYLKIRKGFDDPVVCATPLPVDFEFTKINDGGYSRYGFKKSITDFNFIGLDNSFIVSFGLIGEINLLTGELSVSVFQKPVINGCTIVPAAIEIAGYDIVASWTPLEALIDEQGVEQLKETFN